MAEILVVEDNVDVRRVISQALEYVGHDVEAVPDGWNALIGFRRRGADLVILDVATSEPEGHRAISEIRSLHDQVKVLALAGGGSLSPEQTLAAMAAFGADDVLAKPFALIDLLTAVDGLLPVHRFPDLVAAS
jgi:two-component system OmpR family response regulator